MKLSKYVHEYNGTLFNLTTRKKLPINASEEELRNNYFLEGQEHDAIDFTLFKDRKPNKISLKITPTWKCNLRCTHCFVLDKLSKKQESDIDVDKLLVFVKNYVDYFQGSVTRFYCCLVGGEVSLEVDKCLEITEKLLGFCKERGIEDHFSLTTNGIEFNLKFVELLNRCKGFTISVDGVAENHNKQRHAATSDLRGKNLYDIVLKNIYKLIKLGFYEKLSVQAALKDLTDKEMIRKFFKELVAVGVDPAKIKLGAIAPTKHQAEVNQGFHNHLKSFVFSSPCCSWRLGEEFCVDIKNKLYCDYYNSTLDTTVGELTDPIPSILENHKKLIMREMPVLKDNQCLSCPVIGACWGRCSYVMKVHNPSSICDQKSLIDSVNKKAKSGKLFDIL